MPSKFSMNRKSELSWSLISSQKPHPRLAITFLLASQISICISAVVADELPGKTLLPKTGIGVDGLRVKPVSPVEVWSATPSAYTGMLFNKKLEPLAPNVVYKIEDYSDLGTPFSRKRWAKAVPVDPSAPGAQPCVERNCWVVLGASPPNSPLTDDATVGTFTKNPSIEIIDLGVGLK